MILDLNMLQLYKFIFISFFPLIFINDDTGAVQTPSLKQVFNSKFKIGVALNKNQIRQRQQKENELIKREFSSLTAENVMKWEEIHPKKDRYNFKTPDLLVSLSQDNNQDLIGHTLVWHNQIPQWVTREGDGSLLDINTLFRNITDHITAVAGRYSGKIKGWDVVNEAILDDGSYRENDFYNISGEEYIFKSFEIANRIDPEAELYYNDFSMYKTEKCNAAVLLANKIRERGLRIDGIGLQAHWGLDYPSIDEIEKSILTIHEAGYRVHFTELDIDVLPNLWEIEGADLSDNFKSNDQLNPYNSSLPDSISNLLSKRYSEIFKLFSKHSDKIDRVTFWGLSDGHSWKNDWPAKGRTNYPLLFDRENNPKQAYSDIISQFSVK
jgi:endo-1,4-beta-xylanase